MYNSFNHASGFSQKAGFELSKLQEEDVETFLQWPVSLNNYETGGGKTVVSTIVSLMRGVDVTVVTVPPILIRSWGKWLNKVSDNVLVYQGNPRERAKMAEQLATARWIVVSHAIFRIDYSKIISAQSSRTTEVIVDEAQNLKNVQSILYKKVKEFSAGQACQMLTGTPISKPTDAYSYISLKSPETYRSYGHFSLLHIEEFDFYGQPTKFKNLDLLSESLSAKSVSRTKKELHGYDLTPIFPDCEYDLSKEHYKLYEQLVEEQLLLFDDGTKIDASTAPALRHALQQVICNFDYYSNDPKNRSAVYDMLDQTIEETECNTLGKSKLIVWCKYKRTTRSVLTYLKGLGMNTVAAYSEADSSKSAELFMEDDKTRILVANPQSAGAGLNPQLVCSEAIFLEMDTVSMYMRQSFGRLDRVGQKVRPRMKIATARNTVQVGLLHDLFENDDLVSVIEPTKKGLREMLLGRS